VCVCVCAAVVCVCVCGQRAATEQHSACRLGEGGVVVGGAEGTRGQQRATEDSRGQQGTADDIRGQQWTAGDSRGASEDSRGQHRTAAEEHQRTAEDSRGASEDSRGQQRTAAEEEHQRTAAGHLDVTMLTSSSRSSDPSADASTASPPTSSIAPSSFRAR
jgi:hypothetical protein